MYYSLTNTILLSKIFKYKNKYKTFKCKRITEISNLNHTKQTIIDKLNGSKLSKWPAWPMYFFPLLSHSNHGNKVAYTCISKKFWIFFHYIILIFNNKDSPLTASEYIYEKWKFSSTQISMVLHTSYSLHQYTVCHFDCNCIKCCC